MRMSFHVPDEETLDRSNLADLQRRKLAELLDRIRQKSGFHQRKFAGIQFDPLSDPIERLPFTTRHELQDDQRLHPPFGSNLTAPLNAYNRYHQTSGSGGGSPLRWLDTPAGWDWCKRCWSIVFRGAGLTDEDRLAFPFSFGPFLGFWAAFESAASLRNLCFPAGGMTTAARLKYILDNGITVVCCTPTYALHMAEAAQQDGVNLAGSTIRLLIVAGEPGGNIPSLRKRLEAAWGARVIDHAGMTEIGPWGFECVESPGGMHVIESEFIAEVVDPVTAQAVGQGELGELVLTNLGRVDNPLIRYRTGDQVRMTTDRCACGRHFARLPGGILGRTDDMLIIRGNNVFPSAVEAILREFDEIVEFRLTVHQQGALTELGIELEARTPAAPALAERASAAIRDRLHFRPDVKLVAPGTLPRFEMKAARTVRRKSESP